MGFLLPMRAVRWSDEEEAHETTAARCWWDKSASRGLRLLSWELLKALNSLVCCNHTICGGSRAHAAHTASLSGYRTQCSSSPIVPIQSTLPNRRWWADPERTCPPSQSTAKRVMERRALRMMQWWTEGWWGITEMEHVCWCCLESVGCACFFVTLNLCRAATVCVLGLVGSDSRAAHHTPWGNGCRPFPYASHQKVQMNPLCRSATKVWTCSRAQWYHVFIKIWRYCNSYGGKWPNAAYSGMIQKQERMTEMQQENVAITETKQTKQKPVKPTKQMWNKLTSQQKCTKPL